MSLTVLQVVGNRGAGGMERAVVDACRGLKDRGLRVVMACKRNSWVLSELPADFEAHTLPLRRFVLADSLSPAILTNVIKAVRPDIVHAHGPVAYACVVRSKYRPAQLLASAHGLQGWSRNLAKADAVVAVSEWMQARVKRIAPNPRLRVIYNGIDGARFSHSENSPDAFLREFNLEGKTVVTCVGRLVPCKGQHVLLRAIARTLPAFPDARFVIVGSRSDSYERKLRKLAVRLGVNDVVVFAGEREDVPQILASAQIAVQPSLEEAQGLSVIEAMAGGLPVIGSRVGGIAETIVDGVTGLLVAPRNADDLASALLRLLNDSGLRKEMGQQGRERALTEFSSGRMIDQMIALYEELADTATKK